MPIDLPKSLNLPEEPHTSRAHWRPSLLHVLVALCVLNFLVAAGAITLYFLPERTTPEEKTVITQTVAPTNRTDAMNLSSQLVVRLVAKLDSIDDELQNVRMENRTIKKEIASLSTIEDKLKKQERMKKKALEKAGLSADQLKKAMRETLPGSIPPAELSVEEKQDFDTLIDNDDTGASVEAFISQITQPARKAGYIQHLQEKGDQWADAALDAVTQGDAVYSEYSDNADYFYTIISRVSDNTSLLAYIGARRSQLDLAIQNLQLQDDIAWQQDQTAEQIDELQERTKPKITRNEALEILREQRRQNIHPYESSGIVKPYETDWNPDPRERLKEQQDQRSVPDGE